MSHDSTLLAIASKGPVDTYAEVASRLRALDAELDPRDGLVWFNRWYAALIESLRRHRFVDAAFVERLECSAAQSYFEALASHLADPGSGPACWDPLLEARYRIGVLPIQHAIAAINAHLNHDLPVALAATVIERELTFGRQAPAHADYARFASIVDGVTCNVNAWLSDARGEPAASVAEGAAFERGPAPEHDPLDAQAQLEEAQTLWSTKRACEAAWVAAEVRWALRGTPSIAHHHLEALDRMVSLAGRALLRRWQPSPRVERRPSIVPSR
jgi:hypothetical protein